MDKRRDVVGWDERGPEMFGSECVKRVVVCGMDVLSWLSLRGMGIQQVDAWSEIIVYCTTCTAHSREGLTD